MSNRSHGLTVNQKRPRVYRIWADMNNRCQNRSHRSYDRYGGAGIKVCREWTRFERFLSDMGEPPSPAHVLGRRDKTKGYDRENCHWCTQSEAQSSRRNVTLIEYKGRSLTIAQWCRELGISRGRLSCRLLRGWTVEEAFEIDRYGRANRRRK